MSLSDRLKAIIHKSESDATASPALASSPAPISAESSATIPSTLPTLEELNRAVESEKKQSQTQMDALEKEIQGIKTVLEKAELTSKTQRDSQQRTLQFLQQ